MEKNINKKIEQYQIDFKTQIKEWFEINNAEIISTDENSNNLKSEFLQFIFDNPSLVFDKEDFQKRKRIKNIVAINNLCIAKRANGEQCTRSKKHETGRLCGTHIKGTPYGEINSNADDK